VSSIAAIKQQESCKACKRRNLKEKSGFYAVAISKTGEQIGYRSSQIGAHARWMEGNLDASVGFGANGGGRGSLTT
jgi:hypothetical protein